MKPLLVLLLPACLGALATQGCRQPQSVTPKPQVVVSEVKPTALPTPTALPSKSKPSQKKTKESKRVLAPVVTPLPEPTANPIIVAIKQNEKKQALEEGRLRQEAYQREAEVQVASPWESVNPTKVEGDCMTNTWITGTVRNVDNKYSHSLVLTWGIYDSAGQRIGAVSAKIDTVAPGTSRRYKAAFLDMGQGNRPKFESANSDS